MLLLAMLPLVAAVHFTPYAVRDQYKCGSFVAEQISDPFMTKFYSILNGFIRLLSRPFQYERLLNTAALKFNVDEIKRLIVQRYTEYLDHEQWWLLLSGSLVISCAFFTVACIMYSFCKWCCCRKRKRDTMDAKHDACKRYILNCLIGIFVVINVFAVVTLLISSQYAQYGAEELPRRFGQCLDDITSYKRETEDRIKKLFIEDTKTLSKSAMETLAMAGPKIMERVKKATNVHIIDALINITVAADVTLMLANETESELTMLNQKMNKLRSDFFKLYIAAREDLTVCINMETYKSKAACKAVLDILNKQVNEYPSSINGIIIPQDTYHKLHLIVADNITTAFMDVTSSFAGIEQKFQEELDKNKDNFQTWFDDLKIRYFKYAEDLTSPLSKIKLDSIYRLLNSWNDRNGKYRSAVRYCWYTVLFLSGLFALIALYFLFAWCYGCFGSRPTYYEDDCCVRTTGGRLFTCGICLSLVLLVFFSVVTATLLLVGGNISNLLCHPLYDPLNRKDILAFVRRIIAVNLPSIYGDQFFEEFLKNFTMSAVIQACLRNDTLYTILNLDKKFGLLDFDEMEKSRFKRLDKLLNETFTFINVHSPQRKLLTTETINRINTLQEIIRNISGNNDLALTTFRKQFKGANFTNHYQTMEELLTQYQNIPNAVTSVREELGLLEANSGADLLESFDSFLRKLGLINQVLSNITVPINDPVGKLHHAEAVLNKEFPLHFKNAAAKLIRLLRSDVNEYRNHIRSSLLNDIANCAQLAEIVRGMRAALCTYTLNPVNGVWAAMFISILCIIPVIIFSSWVIPLYRKMHPYPKYMVHEPVDGNQMSAFATDTYDFHNRNLYRTASDRSSCQSYIPYSDYYYK